MEGEPITTVKALYRGRQLQTIAIPIRKIKLEIQGLKFQGNPHQEGNKKKGSCS